MNTALLMLVLTVVVIVAATWWALYNRPREATPHLPVVLPADCAQCQGTALLEHYDPEEPLGNGVVIMCDCDETLWWHGRDAQRLTEEWNETQRIARGGRGTERDTDA